MKNVMMICGFVLVAQFCFGQQISFYEFEPIHTIRKLKENKDLPIVYSVDEVVFEKIIAVGLVPILNKEYSLLEQRIKKLEKDSIIYHNKLSKALKKQNDYTKIINLINQFNSSPKSYENKKEKLIQAQKMADSYRISELIYADENINPSKRAKFLVLKLDQLDLKVHLKRVVWRVQDLFISLPSPNSSTIDASLQELRVAIKDMEKYSYKDGGSKTLTREGMVIKNKVHNFNTVEGEYERLLGSYYVVHNGYKKVLKKGEIINSEIAVKNNLIERGYVSSPKVLIKQSTTGNLFLVDLSFVNKYAFLINGKFNRNELPVETNKKSNGILSD